LDLEENELAVGISEWKIASDTIRTWFQDGGMTTEGDASGCSVSPSEWTG